MNGFSGTATAPKERRCNILNDTGSFKPVLVSTNSYGCRDTAKSELTILPQLSVYFPNAFTPDGNHLNDTWQPVGMGIASVNIIIYDRWGGHVFKTDKLNEGWDGTLLGKGITLCPDGIYPYIVTLRDINGKKYLRTGSVLLVNTRKY